MNRRVVRSTSGFRGVRRRATNLRRPWEAYIRLGGQFKSLGYFLTAEEAAGAYDRAAVYHFGEFACTNQAVGLLPWVKPDT